MSNVPDQILETMQRERLHEEAAAIVCAGAMLMCSARLQSASQIREILMPMRSACIEAIRLLKLIEAREAVPND